MYLTSADNRSEIESKIIYSILQKQPKRADIYWFVHVDVVDEPYRMEYKVSEYIHDDVIRIDFLVGIPRGTAHQPDVPQGGGRHGKKQAEADITSRYASLNKNQHHRRFPVHRYRKIHFVRQRIALPEKVVLEIPAFLKHLSLSEEKAFGLDTSSVTVETVPLIIAPPKEIHSETH